MNHEGCEGAEKTKVTREPPDPAAQYWLTSRWSAGKSARLLVNSFMAAGRGRVSRHRPPLRGLN